MAQPVVPEAGTGSTGPGAELERRAGRSRRGGTWTAWGSDGGGYSVSRGALAVLGSTPPWVTLRLERSESVRRCLAPAAPFRVLVLPARHQLGSSCRRSGRSGGAVLRCRRDNGCRHLHLGTRGLDAEIQVSPDACGESFARHWTDKL